jgi:large subunit ribosomal protein L18
MATRTIKKNRTFSKINKEKYIVTVYRSNLNILAQVLEAKTLRPLYTANSYKLTGNKTEQAVKIGEQVANFLTSIKVDEINFNRNGYLYHGRVKAVAEKMRELNIKF